MSNYLVNEDGEVLSSVSTDAPVLYSFYTPHQAVTLDCGTEMITKQEFKDECDINNIIYQYRTTGIVTHINNSTASFQDLPDVSDFQESLSLIATAEDAFASLPSKVRDRYENDPARFLTALSDPSERDFLTEVGIFKTPVEPTVGLSRPGAPVVPRTPAGDDGTPGS